MNRKIVAASLAVLCIVVAVFLYTKSQTSGHMTFPKTPHGRFVRNPAAFSNGSAQGVDWILPSHCARASYEVQEEGYIPGSKMFWGGVENSKCATEGNNFRCQAAIHPEMEGNAKRWIVQASAYDCDDGEYYVSEAILLD